MIGDTEIFETNWSRNEISPENGSVIVSNFGTKGETITRYNPNTVNQNWTVFGSPLLILDLSTLGMIDGIPLETRGRGRLGSISRKEATRSFPK
jgi:hypothetical protein